MPTYDVTVEGSDYEVDAPDENTAWQWAYMTHQQRPAPKQSTIAGELKRGAKQLLSSTQTGIGAITAPEEAARAGVERAQKIAEEAGEGVSFEPVKEAYKREGILSALGTAAGQVPRAVAQMAPAAGATMAGARVGALAGTAAAPFLGPFAPFAPLVGGALGAGAALYPSMAGSNIERQAQEQLERGQPIDINRPAAYGAAVGQTALEAAGTGAILGKRLVKGVLGIADDAVLASAKAREELIKEANRSLLGAVGKGAMRGTVEIPTEVAQAVLERAQAGLDVMSPEALAEYGDTAYQTMLAGPAFGAITGVPERAQARAELARLEPSKEQQEAQRRFLAARERERAEAAAPKGYEDKQGLLFEPTKVKAEKEKLPTDPAAIQAEFAELTQQEQTPEIQDRMAKLARQYEAVMAKQPEAAPEVPAEQMDLGLEAQRRYADMELEAQRLMKQPKTPETKARITELRQRQRQMVIDEITQGQAELAQRKREEQMAAASAFAPETPARPTGYTAEGQGRLFTPTEMRESGLRRGEEKPVAEPQPTTPKQMERAGQRRLPFEKAEKPAPKAAITGETGITKEEVTPPPPTEAVPEPKLAPKYPAELQPVMDKLTAAGVRPETQAWAQKTNNRPFLRKLMDMAPEAAPEARKALKLKEGTPKAEVFDALFPTPRVPAFEPAPGAGESRLGLLGQLGITPPAAPAPGAGEPVRPRVVPARRAAPAPAAPEVGAKPALEKPLPSKLRAEQFWKDTAEAVGGKTKPFSELTPAQRAAWREAVKLEDVDNLRSEYERIMAEGPSKAEEIRAREQAKREAAEAKRAEQERIKAEKEAEAKRKAEAAAERERAKRETEAKRKAKEASEQLKALVERMDAEQAAREAEAKRKAKEAEAARKAKEAEAKRKAKEAEAARKAKEAEAKRKAKEAEAERKAKEAEEVEAQRKLEALPPYEERVKLSEDDLYPQLKDFDSAVSAIYDRASSPAERTIASLIKTRVEQLKKLGFTFLLRVTPEGKMLSSGARGTSQITYSPIGEATSLAIALNHPSNGEQSGTRWRTVAHELLHAVTQAQIRFAPEGSAAKKLKALFNDVVDYFNARAKAKTLTDFETRIYNGEINALEKPDELLTWGLTDKDMQNWLNGIESKKGNFLSRLYDVVASVLGFSKPNSALAELLSVSETLLTEPTDAYIASANLRGASFGLQKNISDVPNWALGFADGLPVVWFENDAALIKAESYTGKTIYLLATPEGASRVDVASYTGDLLPAARLAEVRAIADTFRAAPETETMAMRAVPSPTEGIAETSELMKEQPGEVKKALKEMFRVMAEKDDVSRVTRFRTLAADSAASVVNRLNILFDGRIRDEITKTTNPEQLIRQAQAPEPLVAAYFKTGNFKKDEVAGQWVVPDEIGPGGAPEELATKIADWGKANGMKFDVAYAEASKMIEARRLNELIKANKENGKKIFPIHKLSNKDERSAEEQVAAALRGLAANPDIQDVADRMDKQRFARIDDMVAVGRITKEEGAEYKEAVGYVPFDRIEDFFSKYKSRRVAGKGLAQYGSLPEFVGSTSREVGNVISNHMKLMSWMISQTIKQDAAYTTLSLLTDIGQARRLGRTYTNAENSGNVIEAYDRGHRVYFEVNTYWDTLAFKSAPEIKSSVLKMFQSVSNILRKIVTVMPPFVAKQVTDDIQRGFLFSGVKEPYKLVLPAITNFLRIAGHELVFGKSHPITVEFSRKGLVGDVDYNASNPAETILFNMGYSQRGWLSALHHRLESVTRASDLAIRKAIYDRTLVETKSAAMQEGDMGLAMVRAREFINFRRRGASSTVSMAIATVPFFNAYIQSTDLLLRSATGRGAASVDRATAKRMFWLQASKMLGFSLIYALVASGDDEYKEQALDERANNWIINGKELPVPGDLAALFKVPVEALVQYMSRLGTPEEQLASEAVKQTLGYAYEQFVGRVTPIPQAIRPVAEALVNHSFVTGRKLVGTYQEGMPAPLQTVTSTSELAKAIAKFAFENIKDPLTDTPLELSPIIIDNTLRGYLGGAVPLMNMLIDQMLNPNKTDRPLSQYWFLSQYLTPEVPQGPKEEFYDLVNKVMPVKRAYDKLAKEDMEAAVKYAKENEDKLKMAELVNIGLTDLRQTREYIKYLDSAEGAKKIESSAERLKIKQQVQEYENQLLDWVRKAKTQIFLNQKG